MSHLVTWDVAKNHLVGGFELLTPLKNGVKVSWDDEIPNTLW